MTEILHSISGRRFGISAAGELVFDGEVISTGGAVDDVSAKTVTATGGSTGRTLAEWVADPINILGEGAVGGNAVADTDGLTRAIERAGYGGIIRIPRTASAYLFDAATVTAAINGVRRVKIDATGATITPGSACAVLFDLQASESELVGLNINDPTGLATIVLRLKKTESDGIDNYRMRIRDWFGSGNATGTTEKFMQVDGADAFDIDDVFALNFWKGLEVLDGGVDSSVDRFRTLGGRYGVVLDTVTGDAQPQGEGISLSRLKVFPTVANAIGLQVKSGLQYTLRDSIIDAKAASGGVGLDIDGTDSGKGIDGFYASDCYIGGAPSATACKVRGTTADISLDSMRFAGDNTSNSTAGLSVDACPSITVRNSKTKYLTGVSAAFSGGTNGLVENCDFDVGSSPTESSDCAITWDTDHDVPSTRAALSKYPRSLWTPYTPTVFPTGGSITTVSGAIRFVDDGKVCRFQGTITLTTNGTGSGVLVCTLPRTPKAGIPQILQAHNVTDNLGLSAYTDGGGAAFAIATPAGLYPGVSGRTYVIGGTYEVA